MSATPCDQGSHEWRVIATLGEVEGVMCEYCGWCRVRDLGTGRFRSLVCLNEHFQRDEEREERLAEAILKR